MKKPLIKMSLARKSELMGIVLWSAHYHGGQWSQEYRMGCRARQLLARSNEIGAFLASRWFDNLEHFVAGTGKAPKLYCQDFTNRVKKKYDQLAAVVS